MTRETTTHPLSSAAPAIPPVGKALPIVVWTLDVLLGISVVGLVVFATAAFGTVKPWSEWYAILTGACTAGGLALRVALAGGMPRTSAYVPIIGFLAIAVFQMVPLPDWLVGAISPQTLADKSRLLADLPGAADRLRFLTISYFVGGGMHDLRIVLLDVAIFLTVLTICRRPGRMVALLVGFSIVAAALACVALLQDFLHAPNILWINGADTTTASGPFVNHSDFSQQMNQLCGWALALLLVIAGGAWPKERWSRAWRIGAICLLATVFVAGFVATLYCQSRGGIACAVLAGGLALVALAWRGGRGGLVWIVVVVGCVALAVALCSGFTSVYDHMLSIRQSGEYLSRVSNVKDILGISKNYPLLGSGLGSHSVFFPRFQSSSSYGSSTHAEVEYAQALEETGYLGLGFVLLFVGIIWINWKRAVVDLDEPITIAAIGLGFGFAAVVGQSFSDFGQHLPSLGCLTAATCALLINLARLGAPRIAPAVRSAMAGRTIFAVVAVATAVWCALGARRNSVSANLFDSADSIENFMDGNAWYRTPRSNAELLNTVHAALEDDPYNVGGYLMQGWYEYAAATTPLGSGSPEPSPNFVPQVVIDPNHPDLAKIQAIADTLNQARWLCPSYGPLYTLVGDMEQDPLHAPIAAHHIRLGAELAPHEPQSVLLAAKLDARQGLWDQARRLFAAALVTRADCSGDIVSFYVNEVRRPDQALAIAPNNVAFLQLLSANTADPAVRQAATARVRQLLIVACAGPNPSGNDLAALAELRRSDGDLRSAVELYKRAVVQDYGQVTWHLALAKLLLQLNDRAGAQAEAAICLHLQPGMQAAQDVLDAISTLPSQ